MMTTIRKNEDVRMLWAGLVLAMLLGLAPDGYAQGGGTVTPVSGEVEFQATPESAYTPLRAARDLAPDANVRTGSGGIAVIRYADGTEVTVKPGSVVRVGGEGQEGVWVRLGRVLVRAQRLLSSGREQEIRTPVAVAAIRGTEFGVYVDESTRSQVYVFEGMVAVSNVQLPDREVLVREGEMTTVEPLRPPTPPSPFQRDEFDRLGRLGVLERAEDPVLESSESPVVESYVAFPDPDIDPLRNPAYLSESRGFRSTSLVSAYGSGGGERVEAVPAPVDASKFAGRGVMGQHVTLLPAGTRGRVGVSVQGDAGHDEAAVLYRAPLQRVSELRQRTSDRRTGEVLGMVSGQAGKAAFGMGADYRKSRLDVKDVLPDGSLERTVTHNRISAATAGVLLGPGRSGTVGVSFSHQFLKSTAESGTLDKRTTGGNNVLEGLYRWGGGKVRKAGVLRLERVKTVEDVVDAGTMVYHEHREVRSAKGGMGIGLTPTDALVLGVDLVGGLNRETAVQYGPDGGVLENEGDWRYSATLHVGTQIYLTPSVLVVVDVLHQAERITEEFRFQPGTAGETRERDVSTYFRTSATTGIGYVRETFLVEYYLAASQDGSRPFSHNVVLSVTLF